MKKRIIAIVLATVLALSTLALSVTAFGGSQELVLNVKKTAVMSGVDDLEWFYYTPPESGVYSFLSYNIPKCEAYLFVKERQPDGSKVYTQLAYACGGDPNYIENGHNEVQFCLTYHLEAGITYHFAAGWYLSEKRTDGQMTVMLRNDSYDNNPIESIELGTPITLEAYSNGNWNTDSNGESFYMYDTSRIVTNLSVTVHYKDGTSSTVKNSDVIDGYPIMYLDNQYYNHWYANEDSRYNGNILTVSILDVSATVSIPIVISATYLTKGTVVNMAGQPVKNADVYLDNSKVATTDDDGIYSFYHSSGEYNLKVKTSHSIDRTTRIRISVINADNDHTSTPLQICNCDFVKDGIINAKDFAFINKYADEADKTALKTEFSNCINFTQSNYE